MQRSIFRVQARPPQLDVHGAAMRHRIARVGRQVEQDQLHGTGVGLHHGALGVRIKLQLDGSRQEATQRVDHLPQVLDQAEWLQIELTAPAEPEQLLDQIGPTASRFRQVVEIATQIGPVIRHGLRREPRLREDDREQVVEVVGDAARELADGFHFLRLAQRVFERPLFRDVFGHHLEAEQVALLATHGPAAQAHDDAMAVLALPLDFDALYPRRVPELLDQRATRIWIRVHVAREIEGQHFGLGFVAEHRDERRVDLQEPAVETGAVDAVGRIVHQGAVFRARPTPRLLGPPAARVLDDDGADALWLAARVGEGKVRGHPVPRHAGLGGRLPGHFDVQGRFARREDALKHRLEPQGELGEHLPD